METAAKHVLLGWAAFGAALFLLRGSEKAPVLEPGVAPVQPRATPTVQSPPLGQSRVKDDVANVMMQIMQIPTRAKFDSELNQKVAEAKLDRDEVVAALNVGSPLDRPGTPTPRQEAILGRLFG